MRTTDPDRQYLRNRQNRQDRRHLKDRSFKPSTRAFLHSVTNSRDKRFARQIRQSQQWKEGLA